MKRIAFNRNLLMSIMILLFLALSSFSFAETVVLKTGQTIEGKITEKTAEYIKIEVADVPLTYYFEDIESIDGKTVATQTLKETRIAEANPDEAGVDYNRGTFYFNRGTEYLAKGSYDQAILDFTEAIEINSNDADAYTNRANAYFRKKNYDQAILDFTKAIEIKPNFFSIYLNRGNAYAKKDNLDQAISDYTKAIEINPDFGQAYYSRGFAYLLKGDIDQANSDYNKMKELNVPVDEGFRLMLESYQYKEKDILYTPTVLEGDKNMTIKLKGNIGADERLIRDTLRQLELWSSPHNKNMFKGIDVKIIKFGLKSSSSIEEWTVKWDDGSSKKFQIKFMPSPTGGTVIVLTEDQF